MDTKAIDRARTAKGRVRDLLVDVPELAGVGITRVGAAYGVKVNLTRSAPGVDIPDEIDGVPIRVEIVGRIRKRAAE